GERLAAIGRVAAGVAHEIRNPIAAMRLKAESAIAGAVDRKDSALSAILEQIARLDALVRRLLSVSEQGAPRLEPVRVGDFLDQVIGAHAELAGAKRLTVERRGDGDLTAAFDCDQMRQALDNLVLNAIEAAPAGSRISL